MNNAEIRAAQNRAELPEYLGPHGAGTSQNQNNEDEEFLDQMRDVSASEEGMMTSTNDQAIVN